MGRLTGKYSASNPPPAKRHFAGAYTWEQLDPLIAELKSVAERYSVTPAAVALNWVICKGAIPLGGARTPEQAKANAQALTFRMTDEEVHKLGSLGFEGTS
jgi:aryl-alcohol dehydrogenase-like predicted oxidoreductase